jgi:hypothetical protein
MALVDIVKIPHSGSYLKYEEKNYFELVKQGFWRFIGKSVFFHLVCNIVVATVTV